MEERGLRWGVEKETLREVAETRFLGEGLMPRWVQARKWCWLIWSQCCWGPTTMPITVSCEVSWNRTWTQYSHECNDFDGGECIFINQVRPNQTPRPPQPRFTMNSNDLYPLAKSTTKEETVVINHILRFNNERLDGRQIRTRPILKLHLNMIDPTINEPPFII
jgi:hypothetical protein